MLFDHFFKRSPELCALLEIITRKARECNIKNSTVRQLILPLLKQLVAGCTTPEIADICSLGGKFDPGEYREAHLVTHGTNAWSAAFLSSSNCGFVLIQKIAVASLMSAVCEAVGAITPKRTTEDGLIPMEIISFDHIADLTKLGDEMTKQMGW
jgi:hypothetical protein